jgi:hypothetical protein
MDGEIIGCIRFSLSQKYEAGKKKKNLNEEISSLNGFYPR